MDEHLRLFRLCCNLSCRVPGMNDRRLIVGVGSALVVCMPGWKVHTVEDTTIPWLYPTTEGLDFASLKGGAVRVCESRARLRGGGGEPN